MLKTIIIFTLYFMTALSLEIAQANEQLTTILSLTPELEDGKKVYESCSKCHGEEGRGSSDGEYPQLAGQHRSVIVKQLLDIRSGTRENPVMLPVTLELSRQGNQAIANVAAYIESLEMDTYPDVGDTDDDMLKTAESTYQEQCSSCHGDNGEGMAEKMYPLLQGQNYEYILRQLKRIQSGKRKNADSEMQQIISKMSATKLEQLADYISRLEPAN